jgi:hypothetical protein
MERLGKQWRLIKLLLVVGVIVLVVQEPGLWGENGLIAVITLHVWAVWHNWRQIDG